MSCSDELMSATLPAEAGCDICERIVQRFTSSYDIRRVDACGAVVVPSPACGAIPRAVVPTLSSYGGPAALGAEADAAEAEVVAAYDAARVVANRRHMRSHAWEMQPT